MPARWLTLWVPEFATQPQKPNPNGLAGVCYLAPSCQRPVPPSVLPRSVLPPTQSEGNSPALKGRTKKMLSQQINTEAQTREDKFLNAIVNGTITDPEVDDPKAMALADAMIKLALIN